LCSGSAGKQEKPKKTAEKLTSSSAPDDPETVQAASKFYKKHEMTEPVLI